MFFYFYSLPTRPKINNKDSEGYGSGIGTDEGQSTSSDVSIVNANITLNMFHGAGIGSGGNRGSIGKITVENSTINLTGRFFSGIGSGRGNASCGDIWVVGSAINDVPTSEGVCGMSYGSIDTCIGSGFASSSCGNIYILDSYVEAVNSDSPCIGAGDAGSTCSDIFVSASTINSKSTHGAGVGSGRSSTVLGDITITNGTAITHVSGEDAAIGSGQNGHVNKITITSSSLAKLNATHAYSDSTHAYPRIGRGRDGSASGVGMKIIVLGSDGHWEERLTLEATAVLGEVLNPLKIHHGPIAIPKNRNNDRNLIIL